MWFGVWGLVWFGVERAQPSASVTIQSVVCTACNGEMEVEAGLESSGWPGLRCLARFFSPVFCRVLDPAVGFHLRFVEFRNGCSSATTAFRLVLPCLAPISRRGGIKSK